MKKGILIVGDENEIGMKLLEQQLSERLKRRDYPVEGECFWPGEKETGVFRFRQKGHERVLSTDWILYLEKDMRRIFVHLENGVKISFYGRMEEVLEQSYHAAISKYSSPQIVGNKRDDIPKIVNRQSPFFLKISIHS